MDDKDKARASLDLGRKLVNDTGYHRRDAAVEELEQQLNDQRDGQLDDQLG